MFAREKYVSGCVGVDKSSCLFVCSLCVCARARACAVDLQGFLVVRGILLWSVSHWTHMLKATDAGVQSLGVSTCGEERKAFRTRQM